MEYWLMTKTAKSNLIIYKAKNGEVQLEVRLTDDNLWLSQAQIADLFGTKRQAISKHLNNIYKSGELREYTICSKMEHMHKTNRAYETKYYSLDAVISVGYRVNSKKATDFRIWATDVLKNHIINGYTINRHRIKENYKQFTKAVADVKSLLPPDSKVDSASVLELITMFADTWVSLDAYDKDTLTTSGITRKKVTLTAVKLTTALTNLKSSLIAKGEATELFGTERTKDSIAGIVGNVMQCFGNQDVYVSVEEKAAHLLYFIIKNHPFVDGNKRSGAYAFIWFLQQAKVLDVSRITPPALTALTLLIAESDAKDKEKMVGLVCNMLAKRTSK